MISFSPPLPHQLDKGTIVGFPLVVLERRAAEHLLGPAHEADELVLRSSQSGPGGLGLYRSLVVQAFDGPGVGLLEGSVTQGRLLIVQAAVATVTRRTQPLVRARQGGLGLPIISR